MADRTPDSFSNEEELIAYAVERGLAGDMEFINSIQDKPTRGKAKAALIKAKRSGQAPAAPSAPAESPPPPVAEPVAAEAAPETPAPAGPAKSHDSFSNTDDLIAYAVERGLAGDMEFINSITDKPIRGKAKAALVKAKRAGAKPTGAAASPPPTAKPAAAPAAPTTQPAAPRAAAPAKPTGPTVRAKPGSRSKLTKPLESGTLWMSRRNFLSRAGWAAFFSFLGTMLLGSLRYMFPRVLFEPATLFKAGFPGDYPVGAVSAKWVKDKRTWIVRNDEGFYAIFAQCTHLGCTPRWLEAEGKFKCPCHGSGFTMDGLNFEGPAPRPLERVKITLSDDGQLVIDTSVRFLEEKGQWTSPESFLPFA